ncbi:heme exporter protein A [Roseateles sp. YR242]|uniref:heme ABC exporter ATP-binding protein CcmA n=1 Tax=Roseateles sp. YR242 TaxID=1855305 RepID=UPI0008ABB73C|nr:heme ABC exporter ATP-binding protein CcmA [Roseateles sp. YR242]SEK97818.1 heme exporter protein A [Roseateles sp. YR242]
MTPARPLPPTAPGPLLLVQRVCVRRGGRLLLRDISFSVEPGEVTQLQGANGSGKSSLLRVLAGLVPVEAGSLTGPAAPCVAADQRPDRAYLGHHNGLSPELTARENLMLGLRMEGGPRSAAGAAPASHQASTQAALARVGLAHGANMPARRLSQGQQRRLALARLSLAPGRLWLLDEPLNALDTQGEAMFAELLHRHLASGGAAVIATHQPLPAPAHHTLRLTAAVSSARQTTDVLTP